MSNMFTLTLCFKKPGNTDALCYTLDSFTTLSILVQNLGAVELIINVFPLCVVMCVLLECGGWGAKAQQCVGALTFVHEDVCMSFLSVCSYFESK